ncbi:transglycosylase SLT domain-containing protein [Noviherbaspirillum sedimenti]
MDGITKLSVEEQTALGARHEHAEGVPQDYRKAIALYCMAAKTGHANAQYALGWMYAHGRGIDRDDGIARHFFEMAARQGHTQAQEMLRYIPADAAFTLPACLLPPTPAPVDLESLAPVYPRGPVYDLVHKLAPRYGIDPQLALAIIRVESAFNSRAVSPKNAHGLMQLIPETARRFRVKDAVDPEENIKGALSYLQWLLAFFQGNVPLVVAAYNAGERAVQYHRGPPLSGNTKLRSENYCAV